MKREDFHQRYVKIGDFLFRFQEAGEDAYIWAYKDGDDYALIMFVTAYRDGESTPVANYEKAWEDANNSTAEQFVDKFCRDAAFRASCQTSGERIDDVLPPDSSLVHPRCAQAIKRINNANSKKLKFKDFAALRTYGQDKVSRMKWDELKDLLPDAERGKLVAELGQEQALKVLRWIKRGLKPDHAIHKVRVDMEIAANSHYR